MKKTKSIFNTLLITMILFSACSTTAAADTLELSENLPSVEIDSTSENSQSESKSDGNSNEPDYDLVFPQDEVNEITITISAENWDLMMANMTVLYGEQGSSQRSAPGGQPGMAKMGSSDDQNPTWVEAEVSFSDENWEHIGIRFKGNSSLKNTWSSGSLKLPFKLDFDQYEDEYPETEDQRFYGFKQLSFSSGSHDDSMLREKITADLFREAGVPSAQTAYYAVSIDYGEGPVYFGLYTAVEIVDDTVIETQFNDDNGNVYKPDGAGATFAAGSFSEESFDKETNQDEDDYSDILALYDVLHDGTRTTDPESWRENLEAVFDVETFLNWLAANTVIQNWDTYGVMQHNYYMYNDPDSGQLVWIPWDNNESLKSMDQSRDRKALQFDLNGVDDKWPLVSFLRDDPVYYQKYLSYMNDFLADVFILDEMAETYQYYHSLIAPYVMDESQDFTLINSRQAFNNSTAALIQYTQERIKEAESFINSQ